MGKCVRQLLVFADHYQFYVYDATSDPFTPFPPIGDREMREGWTRTEDSIWYFTQAHNNTHRVDIYLAGSYVDDAGAQRVLVNNLDLSSGRFAIYEHEDESAVQLPPGPYSIYQRAYNLGQEDEDSLDRGDEDLLQRDDLERYEIVIVPGPTPTEGLLRGL